jgi:hypothetical protein
VLGVIVVLVRGGRLLETLSAYVHHNRWEGRQSVGERDREDRGDLSLRVELRAWTWRELELLMRNMSAA